MLLRIFTQRRRADKLQFAAAECGLEQVGRIDGALRRTGPDEGVHLVDNRMTFCTRRTSARMSRTRSSNSPRYFVPAMTLAMSSA